MFQFLNSFLICAALSGVPALALTEPTDSTARQTSKGLGEKKFQPGAVWTDSDGNVINAHGGGVLYRNKVYYWYGEIRGEKESKGVNVYSSKDLHEWKYEGLALATSQDPESDIVQGCIIERPKVIYNKKTRQYVMWFHLELKGKGYEAARAAVATSDKPTGPFVFQKSFRPNGNMSRDMGLFVDDDQKAYHIYSSRENYDLRICELTADYLSPTPKDSLLFSNHREAPALFRKAGEYYLITSGCTGWAPNKASLHTASSLFGPWTNAGDPMRGPKSELTFGGQSTYVLPVAGKKDSFIFMADIWKPSDLKDSRYVWLPILFEKGQPVVEWRDEWGL